MGDCEGPTCEGCQFRLEAWKATKNIGWACRTLIDDEWDVYVFGSSECPCGGERFEEE